MALSQLSVAQRGCITEGYASGLIHCGYGNVRGRQSSSLGRCVMHCGLAGWLAGWLAGNCPLVGLPRINRDVDESSGGQMVAGPGIPHSAFRIPHSPPHVPSSHTFDCRSIVRVTEDIRPSGQRH
jgi:hypothetical protein